VTEDHGDSSNITVDQIQAAADAADITPERAAQNIYESAQAMA
jgi:hypothetical protein